MGVKQRLCIPSITLGNVAHVIVPPHPVIEGSPAPHSSGLHTQAKEVIYNVNNLTSPRARLATPESSRWTGLTMIIVIVVMVVAVVIITVV